MKIALVTGANRGLGLETSKQLAELGYKVYMVCRNDAKGRRVVSDLQQKGLSVELIQADITADHDVKKIMDVLSENNEVLDVLVNNAGVFLESESVEISYKTSILKVDPSLVSKILEINTLGPLKLIQAIVPTMCKENSGRIINVSSMMGQLEGMLGHWPGYRMSKTALNAITCMLNAELSKTNVIVNSVCPGWVRTDMGGRNATKSVAEGVESIIWLATCENPPRGKFVQDRKIINW